jgi:biotin operon repressor
MYIKREIKARLGINTKIISTDNKLPTSQQGIGGQMVICHSTITQHIKRIKSDESGLGIFLGIGIQLQHS